MAGHKQSHSAAARAAVLFDDGRGELGPLTDLRPSFAVRTGALTTRERLTRALGLRVGALWVRPEHEAMAREAVAGLAINAVPTGLAGEVLVVNGRCVVPPGGAETLAAGEVMIEAETGDVVAACVRAEGVAAVIDAARRGDAAGGRVISVAGRALLRRPWDVRTLRDLAVALDLSLLVESLGAHAGGLEGVTAFGGHALAVHASAKVYPGVVLDHESGPIVIDEHAVIRPGSTIIGPAYIGAHSTVLDRAVIKGNTAIGPHCKVAGEVGGTIFHGYANKAHDGHLGDSWVGKWANLGAGTTNSNLLNTYGEVAMRATPTGPLERTGQQFMGAIIGDHVKTAICTRIMTGTVLGTGVMYAATAAASGTVPAFSWCTDEGRKGFRLEKFVEVAKAVMMRRKVEAGAGYWARVAEMHTRAV